MNPYFSAPLTFQAGHQHELDEVDEESRTLGYRVRHHEDGLHGWSSWTGLRSGSTERDDIEAVHEAAATLGFKSSQCGAECIAFGFELIVPDVGGSLVIHDLEAELLEPGSPFVATGTLPRSLLRLAAGRRFCYLLRSAQDLHRVRRFNESWRTSS